MCQAMTSMSSSPSTSDKASVHINFFVVLIPVADQLCDREVVQVVNLTRCSSASCHGEASGNCSITPANLVLALVKAVR